MVIVCAVPGSVGVTLSPDGFLRRERAGGTWIPVPMALAISALATGDVWNATSTHTLAEGRASLAQASFPIPGRRSVVPGLENRLARRAVTKS